MKKWQVLAAASLLGALAALRLLPALRRSAPAAPDVSTGQTLTAGATQYIEQAERLANSPQAGSGTTYTALPTIKDPAYDRGPCAGGSLNEIFSAHGRVWGRLGRYLAFTEKESAAVYSGLADYFACVGLAKGTPAPCDYLPADGSDGRNRVSYEDSANAACRAAYLNVAFPGFAAGRAEGNEACGLFLVGDEMSGGPQVPAADFCAAASKGLGGICPAFAKAIPRGRMDDCRRAFPSGLLDCGFSQACRDRLHIFEALKAGKPSGCPSGERGLCEAYLSRKEEACSALLLAAEKDYCSGLAAATKRAGGYPGYSPEETKEAIRRAAADKADKERQAEISRRTQEEVNKRVKEIMAGQKKK